MPKISLPDTRGGSFRVFRNLKPRLHTRGLDPGVIRLWGAKIDAVAATLQGPCHGTPCAKKEARTFLMDPQADVLFDLWEEGSNVLEILRSIPACGCVGGNPMLRVLEGLVQKEQDRGNEVISLLENLAARELHPEGPPPGERRGRPSRPGNRERTSRPSGTDPRSEERRVGKSVDLGG